MLIFSHISVSLAGFVEYCSQWSILGSSAVQPAFQTGQQFQRLDSHKRDPSGTWCKHIDKYLCDR